MRLVYSENLLEHSLPAGHRFPIGKYRLLYDRVRATHGGLLQRSGKASLDDVRLVHDGGYVQAVAQGTLPEAAVRRLGFPWSEGLVERALRSVGGTLAALSWALETGASGHLAGGTHHAFADRGEGFCVFNDLAVAVAVARRDHGVRRVAVVDLDVHQGNGTARLLEGDPDAFTLSLHGQKNYPFKKERGSLDVGLPDLADDDAYMAALGPALERVEAFRPDLVLYQAGVDCLAGDRFGRLALTLEGLASRDRMVLDMCIKMHTPVVVVLGGGYHPEIGKSIEAHHQVFAALASRFG